jgi:hypothetical protein
MNKLGCVATAIAKRGRLSVTSLRRYYPDQVKGYNLSL